MDMKNYTKHWSGTRSGFNTRGGTDREHLAAQRDPSVDQEWTRQRALLAEELAGLMGQQEYYLWARETITIATPREAYALTAEKLAQVHRGYDRLWQAVVELDVAVEL